jgi:hypothetical protein
MKVGWQTLAGKRPRSRSSSPSLLVVALAEAIGGSSLLPEEAGGAVASSSPHACSPLLHHAHQLGVSVVVWRISLLSPPALH